MRTETLQTPLFTGLTAEEIKSFTAAARCRQSRFSKGALLLRQGEPVQEAGILLSGSVKAYALSRQGAESIQAVVKKGGMFGDVLMATERGASPVTVEALEDAAVLFVPFAGIMDCPGPLGDKLRINLLHELSQRYWALSRKVAYLSASSLRGRIARYLLDQAEESAYFSLPVTREGMAALLGVNRSALSRELSRMQREGLLSYYKNSFRLLDSAALREASLE